MLCYDIKREEEISCNILYGDSVLKDYLDIMGNIDSSMNCCWYQSYY